MKTINEIVVLQRKGDPDDSMFSAYTGTVNGYGIPTISTFWEKRRARNFIGGFLRKTGKSNTDYNSTEEILNDFLDYCAHSNIESTAAAEAKEIME